jgi:hypothetical protein
MAKGHVYSQGEYAYFTPKGEIVKIIGSTKTKGFLGDKYLIRVLSLKQINPVNGKPKQFYDCNGYALLPIMDEDVQYFLRMTYESEKFNLIRQL